jgi:hypothetical protein
MKVRFFYRDGDNYKCNWLQDVDSNMWNEFKANIEVEGETLEEYLDKELQSGNLFEIEQFGLTMYDIPIIMEYGKSDMDHNYVSIIEYGEDLK